MMHGQKNIKLQQPLFFRRALISPSSPPLQDKQD